MTDPCEELSGRFVPKYLAHDVASPTVALLQLQQHRVPLLVHSESGRCGAKTIRA